MFKKKNNNKNNYSDYKHSLTIPFEVSYEDENPQKMRRMRKEIERQEREDPTNPKNIISILERDKEKSIKRLSSSRSIPCIKPEDDVKENSPSVKFGKRIINMYNRIGTPLCDAETGEAIRPEFFTTNLEFANVPYQTEFLSNIDLEARTLFIRRVRNIHNN